MGSILFFGLFGKKKCEKSTALTIFYLARPGQLVQYQDDKTRVPYFLEEAFHLVREIRERYQKGSYTQSSIMFDPERMFNAEAYIQANADEALLDVTIPKSMRVTIPGRTLQYNLPKEAWEGSPDKYRVSARVPPPLTEEERETIKRVERDAAAMAKSERAKRQAAVPQPKPRLGGLLNWLMRIVRT